jgi:hypothetical protein
MQQEKKGRMLNKKKSSSRGLARGPLWIITCYRHNRMDILTIDPDADGGFLPVFSFEEEAETFLCLFEDDEKKMEWCIRQTSAGELVSVLMAPCTSVRRVALDPLPLSCGRAALPLLSVSREHFVQELMGERRNLPGKLVLA